jgi:hypothetical protein
MTLTVRVGSGGSAASWSGFTSSATVSNGTRPGSSAANARTYRLVRALPTTAPLSAEGGDIPSPVRAGAGSTGVFPVPGGHPVPRTRRT